MQRFNTDPKIFVFILSTRSGGVGMNLTGADTVRPPGVPATMKYFRDDKSSKVKVTPSPLLTFLLTRDCRSFSTTATGIPPLMLR